MSVVRKILSLRFLRKKKSTLTPDEERDPPPMPQPWIPPSSASTSNVIDITRTASPESSPFPQSKVYYSSENIPGGPSVLVVPYGQCTNCKGAFQESVLRTCVECKKNKFCSFSCQLEDTNTSCKPLCRNSAKHQKAAFELRYRINIREVLEIWILENRQVISSAFKRGLSESPTNPYINPHAIFIDLKDVALKFGSDRLSIPVFKAVRVDQMSIEPIKDLKARWKKRENEHDWRLWESLISNLMTDLNEQLRQSDANKKLLKNSMVVIAMVEDEGVAKVLRIDIGDDSEEKAQGTYQGLGDDWRGTLIDSLNNRQI